ncbi:MAG: NUDIX domain-containing protein [Oculatellaceae cyanobacterium Prado106]|jgi:8-oxo-dGTP pyrophosphatase MutT (NUDIX family)|nr:NUDIX domain-containing protein [Oculatellaceae cyanobacterium Prado106]
MEKIVFESPKSWLQVIETPRKYYYARRKNKDSIAVFLVRRAESGWEVLVRMQPLPIHNADLDEQFELFPCPFTGGMDGGESPLDCAARETFEESGYAGDDLQALGHYFVGTQTDETVYLFWKDVTDLPQQAAPQDGSYFESISRNEWRSLSFLKDCSYSACQIGYYKLTELLD